MIVKDEFLERGGIELSISAEFQRHLCHPIGFAGGIDSKSVRFALRDADHCIEKGRGDEKQCAENQRQQRQSSWIGNAAHDPLAAPASDGCIKQNSSKREADEDKNSEVGQQFRTMVKYVMAHLVRHYCADLRDRALFEQIIV